jgi:hypothetical protein
MVDAMKDRTLNPLQLAVTLHWSPGDVSALTGAPDAKRVLDHWLQQIEHFDPIFAPEYLEAPALLAELFIEETGHAGRMARVKEDARFHHWGLCQHLLAESQRAVGSSALLSRDLSELAVAVALRLDPGHYHLSWTEDLRAKAWCVHADSCRRLNQAESALVAFGEAQRHARAGTASAELAARIEKTEMSLSWRMDEPSWGVEASGPLTTAPALILSDEPSSHSRIA